MGTAAQRQLNTKNMKLNSHPYMSDYVAFMITSSGDGKVLSAEPMIAMINPNANGRFAPGQAVPMYSVMNGSIHSYVLEPSDPGENSELSYPVTVSDFWSSLVNAGIASDTATDIIYGISKVNDFQKNNVSVYRALEHVFSDFVQKEVHTQQLIHASEGDPAVADEEDFGDVFSMYEADRARIEAKNKRGRHFGKTGKADPSKADVQVIGNLGFASYYVEDDDDDDIPDFEVGDEDW